MTFLEALKNSVGYPVRDSQLELVLINNGVNSTDEYSASKFATLEMCTADALKLVITMPNVTEGDLSISLADKKTIKDLVISTYNKYGKANPFGTSSVRGISPW
ncbi:MAG: hypothetical protein CVU09_00215 [Bacteroidetes bacterium HGW-Bacteroidetes-4]|jgi:hypothetical protein|nr:MAG: hypothetical protein CVU09_00215 [Bacteroidetes bacterium HGW-Bacteroidetes-4]